MRTWRVGTVSMGASLILLGFALFFAQWKRVEATDIFMGWWPFLLILLGLEILIYLYFTKRENTFVKYDLFSIVFIGLLGFFAIALFLLSSTGLLGEIRAAASGKMRVFQLPDARHQVAPDIKRIVLQTGTDPVVVEGSNDKSVHIFGTYQSASSHDVKKPADYVAIRLTGDTMYVIIKSLSKQRGWFYTGGELSPTVVVPAHIPLEVRGTHNEMRVAPRQLVADWTVSNASSVAVEVESSANLLVTAAIHGSLKDGNVAWKKDIEASQQETPEQPTKGSVQVGKGEHRLQLFDIEQASVQVIH
ncbi:hypothetical protein PNH38_05950 [Anoxybacillus rupiensis]|uniref:DUF5668 domain-containing protein n=1 Tax=Anoxybacteroides rupiense TaxID=311460 RepID=A0ABT5W2D1_9BACL|nr:hypothetical protein [Anoxybacillus rupiensis]MBS2772049.1 hypothetical protein [Anoxybacillus rupiensis]MDE8563429.1 hypothetical protein [Anoxybacillus rupiensis]